MDATVSDFAVQLSIELGKSLDLEQIAHWATQKALVASEDACARADRWARRTAWMLAGCALYASVVTGLLIAGWAR